MAALIQYPVTTEKAIRLIEAENKLIFAVDTQARKPAIKQAVEELFGVRVIKVRTHILNGQKRAYVTLSMEHPALDIATKLGMV